MPEQESQNGWPITSASTDSSSRSSLDSNGTPSSAASSHDAPAALNQFATRLAAGHQEVRALRTDTFLLEHLTQVEREVQEAYRYFESAVEEQEVLSYAAEWLLDNYFVVRQAIHEIVYDLPRSYYDKLPKLVAPGISRGAPRIYVIARAFVEKEEGAIDTRRLLRFLTAYQEKTPLTMGELWALPIMLRMVLLFTLAEAASRVAHLSKDVSRTAVLRIEYELEDDERVAKAITGLRAIDGEDWNELFERVSQVEQVLRRDPARVYALMDFSTRDRYRKVVEQLARGSVYSEKAVADRVVEMAKAGQKSEGSPVKTNTGRTRGPASRGFPSPVRTTAPVSHVGYYLLGEGLQDLKDDVAYQSTFRDAAIDWVLAYPTPVYLGANIVLTGLVVALAGWYTLASGGAAWIAALAMVLAVVPAFTAAVSFTNWIITQLLPARQLPRMEFEDSIPDSASTMVVIPALLSSVADVAALFKQLELHYLRNVDPERHIRFALLTDFSDAPEEEQELDQSLLEAAKSKVAELNHKYPGAPFYFLHRRRRWNPSENAWMGWERKRGKLHEFNRLLRCPFDHERGELLENDTSYETLIGDLGFFSSVRFVITLDADTVLPTGAGSKLIGVMAHPLNVAQFDARSSRVVQGYTVLQPRTEIIVTSANQSLFTRIFAGEPGIDLYTFAVSDVYQDLFGEGIYVGKGIYDVDAFERSLHNRIPENALLSHDLFEGIQGRAGLVTDIVLFEDYPPNYLVKVHRGHRWVRGDWQLLPWLFGRVPSKTGRIKNDLPLIGRWKIFDNLRRSLLAPTLLLFFFAAWILFPGSPLVWTLFGLACLGVTVVTSVFSSILRYVRTSSTEAGPVATARAQRWPIIRSLVLFGLELAFVPYEALSNTHAIALTLGRVYVTRRNMLEWVTAARSAQILGANVSAETTFLHMLPAISVVSLGGVITAAVRPGAVPAALPIWLLWLFAAQIVHRIGRPAVVTEKVLGPEARKELRMLARRTWLFFEHFVGPEDNWLPPDHYQEFPRNVVAHRTSPTNIGLYLVSLLTAHRFGYESLHNVILRLQAAFDSMDRMDRYRGHLYNWVRTNDLGILRPGYISYVDSGNLAACLVVLKQGCTRIGETPVLSLVSWSGLLDTLDLLAQTVQSKLVQTKTGHAGSGEVAGEGNSTEGGQESPVAEISRELKKFRQRVHAVENQPEQWLPALETFAQTRIGNVEANLLQVVTGEDRAVSSDAVEELSQLLGTLRRQVIYMLSDLRALAPGVAALSNRPAIIADGDVPREVQTTWQALSAAILSQTKLCNVQHQYDEVRQRLDDFRRALAEATISDEAETQRGQAIEWCRDLEQKLGEAQESIERLWSDVKVIGLRSERLLADMDFTFLFDRQRKLFHIGFNVDTGRLDSNYYDLLMSEARIGSLFAIADNQVPMSHWLYLSRPLVERNGEATLLSWSGTIFEYLMPRLLMRSYPGTLLHESCRRAVERQIEYAREFDVPWGISESGFYYFDAAMNYQYRAFGVPGLGLKRGLEEDLVISPYASLLALPYMPQQVLDNLASLREYGMDSRYGLYEALDFTKAHVPAQQKAAIVRSYMAHHQGMILLALANACLDEYVVDLFHAEPKIQSVELLLQEQVPATVQTDALDEDELAKTEPPTVVPEVGQSWPVPVDTPMPIVHSLSNGSYTSVVTNAGGGFTTWQGQSITRWRPDATLDDWGYWIYVSDLDSGHSWSVGRQPLGVTPINEETLYSPHSAEFRRRDDEVRTEMKIVIAPDEDVEIRRITISNDGESARRLRLTSYAEVVMAEAGGDIRHPAFAKLFIESEYLPEKRSLLFRRRPRSDEEETATVMHSVVIPNETRTTGISYESDRAKFIGRYRTTRRPAAMDAGATLSETTGPTLDPIMAMQADIVIGPESSVELAFITCVSIKRELAVELVDKYHAWTAIERAFMAAARSANQQMQVLAMSRQELHDANRLLSLLLYPHPYLRANDEILAANHHGQQALWPHGISGDYPILLVNLSDSSDSAMVRQLIAAYKHWYRQGIIITLVIVNQEDSSYTPQLQGFLSRLMTTTGAEQWMNRRGGIFLVRRDQMALDEYVALETAARVVLDASQRPLDDQLQEMEQLPTWLPELITTVAPVEIDRETNPVARPSDLIFDNGWGGFSQDGKEYTIYLEPDKPTPAPWINVIANEEFGFLASENGGGYTWAVNSGENRLTKWRNDPVTDLPAEALYIRDEETGEVWTPTRLPAPAPAPYLVRHGAGYTIHEHNSHGVAQRVRLFAPTDAPVKIVSVRVQNLDSRRRRLSVTYYAEWLLGALDEPAREFIVPEYHDGEQPSLLAHNPYSSDFSERYVVLSADRPIYGLTTDRSEFLGRFGSLEDPDALSRVGLNNTVRSGLDTCAAVQVQLDLPPGSEDEINFIFGQGADREASLALVNRFRHADAIEDAWQALHEHWDSILNSVQVTTPDRGMDILLNRWLLYQALACRIWGRSAHYQSSGAYGFRDQLQDVMALLHVRPDLAREHIVRSASHQFEAGDVLHWWHPPAARGVRTRITDDLLWLPYVTARYVETTDDISVLNEQAPFLVGEPLEPNEHERYAQYATGNKSYSVFEHCCRALEKGTNLGRHGLPLMGGGDWNDGMNRVGIDGKGESIWLGWFLCDTLIDFAEVCDRMERHELADKYRETADNVRQALEENGWDGEWYLRAYFDDGTPLGSVRNRECRIDSIAQSWAVLSQLGDAARAKRAMEAVLDHLVRWDDKLILLFNPPFDKTRRDPGYIKGYLPGIRENGGQYTHAALWTIWAFVELGNGNMAESLFRLINPIYRANSEADAELYKVEPYVISADVYGVSPHVGRGGWTWYTGSSGWMYRLGIEGILGIRRTGDRLVVDPCIPNEWNEFQVSYSFGETCYHITVRNPDEISCGVAAVLYDGEPLPETEIPLVNDGHDHEIEVRMGQREPRPESA